MSEFERSVPVVRTAQTRRGDTLWTVAARELGDPERWYELVYLNSLVAPYLTDDPTAVRDGVLLTGSALRVPGPASATTPAETDPAAVFGIDVALTQGRMAITAGDLATVSGVPNLTQAVRHVVSTEIGGLRFHPEYGCGAHRLIGHRATPDILQLARALVSRAVGADARIDRVTSAAADLSGDVLRVELTAAAITGAAINVISD